MTALRFGLVGCNSVAPKHAESLRRINGAALIAVCDVVKDRAETFAAKYGATPYESVGDMLSRERLDVVSILTPSGDHAERILEVARYGCHVVVEKPLALRVDDADEVITECERAGVRLFVVKQNRLNRPIQALRHALKQGRFGPLVLGTIRVRWARSQAYYDAAPWRGTWALDGGVLMNQASHHIDMLEWMMGPVEMVTAATATQLARIEAEDTAVAILRFKSGALGIIEATTATRPKDLEGSISILGERGSVVVGGFSMDKLVTWNFVESMPEDESIYQTHGQNPPDFAWNHTEYLRGVVAAISDGEEALVNGQEGRKSLELINALYESAETNQGVSLRSRPTASRLGRPNAEVGFGVRGLGGNSPR